MHAQTVVPSCAIIVLGVLLLASEDLQGLLHHHTYRSTYRQTVDDMRRALASSVRILTKH
jgi:hypothetical protein